MPYSVGRASYAIPIRLFDPAIGLASFTTTFSFLVTSNGQSKGDGIAFFMAGPNHSKIPESSSGGYLGLFSPETAFKPIINQIVAVEFDTFANEWDPPYAHVGINANSIRSETTERWGIDSVESNLSTVVATVSYDNRNDTLSVIVNTVNGTTISLSWVADLRGYLPDWIIVGFSGATGGLVETHKILSWTFSSYKYSYRFN
ncbi:lectin 7-like [Medicago truncatula]|nr:lectin 7-like [Medicago truncatula]